MSFTINHAVGGYLDKIKALPYPHFSKYPIPYIKGRQMDIIAPGDYTDTFSLPFDTEFLSVAFATSEFASGDYWELAIGECKICERIYTKGLPESVSMGNSFGIVLPVPKDTVLTFTFHCESMGEALAKEVWYNVKFLRPEDSVLPTE